MIDDKAFAGIKHIAVVDANTVLWIGEQAFNDCENITFILHSSAFYIGDWAFKDCKSLEQSTISRKTKNVGKSIFYGCESLHTVRIEANGIETLTHGMFSGCSSIKEIEIPESIKTVESDAFISTRLIHLTIPSGVQSIENQALWGCNYLKAINVVNGNTYYEAAEGVLFDIPQPMNTSNTHITPKPQKL